MENEEKKEIPATVLNGSLPPNNVKETVDPIIEPDEEEKAPEPEEEELIVANKYMGKEVISEKMVTVNEKEYHSLTLGDGSTHLLSAAEYEESMK